MGPNEIVYTFNSPLQERVLHRNAKAIPARHGTFSYAPILTILIKYLLFRLILWKHLAILEAEEAFAAAALFTIVLRQIVRDSFAREAAAAAAAVASADSSSSSSSVNKALPRF